MAQGDPTRSPYWLPTTPNQWLAGRVATVDAGATVVTQEVIASQAGYQAPTSYGLPTVAVGAMPTIAVGAMPATVSVATLAGLPTVAIGTMPVPTGYGLPTVTIGQMPTVVVGLEPVEVSVSTVAVGTFAVPTTNVVPPATISVATLANLPSTLATVAIGTYLFQPTIAVATLAGLPTVSVATVAGMPSTLATVAVGTIAGLPSSIATMARLGAPSAISTTFLATTGDLVFAAVGARKGISIHHDVPSGASGLLYVRLGATSTASAYTVRMVPFSHYETPFNYQGAVHATWDTPSAFAMVTETRT